MITHYKKTLLSVSLMLCMPIAQAAEISPSLASINTLWVVVAGCLVFLMQAGFALLESGMSRSKNSVNVMMKNYMDLCVGSLLFWLVGYGLMFGTNTSGFLARTFLHCLAWAIGNIPPCFFRQCLPQRLLRL